MNEDSLEYVCLCTQCGRSFQPNPGREDVENELVRYNHEIDKLHKTLATLEKGHDALIRIRDKTHTLVFPVSQLPTEILGEIFSWCAHLPERDDAELARTHRRQGKTVNILTFPILSIAQTCSLWRQVCLSRPNFWTDIIIRFDSMYELPGPLSSGKAQLFGLLEQYLSYSKSLPLTIDLHAFGPPGLGTHDALSSGRVTGRFFNTMSGILTLLSIQMYRWREVVVALDQDLLKRFPDVIPMLRSLPLLESLSIILDEFDDSVVSDGWYLPLSGDSLGTAPLLRRLFIPHSPVVEEMSYFPWSQLTSLTISELKDEFCDVLKPCSMLQSLRILHYSCGTDIPNALDHPYLLPALTRLEICMSNVHSDVVDIPNRLDVFEFLTLPSLSTLIITACGPCNAVIDLASRPTPEWNHESFEWMMERGSFADTLKTLSISDISISLEKMKELLSLTPSLTHFSYLYPHPKEHHPMPSLIGYINGSLPYLTHLELFLPSRLGNRILKAVCFMLQESRIEYFKLKVLPGTEDDQLDSMACFEALGRYPGNNYSIIFDK